jgi:glycosyltransferase involved in cell wall biosynthesis
VKKPKVSIIVPVYKTAQYLPRCLDSIIKQTLEDIEIIIVNDASPDNSHEIIIEYEEKDDRIVYIRHEKNLGLGGARNTGIKAAKAKYIGSVDSDDWIDEDMFHKLYNKAAEGNWDIVVCGFKSVDDEGNIITKTKFGNRAPIEKNIREENIFHIINPAFWNKLWKKDLYIKNNINFPQYVYYQDLATTPRILYFTKSIYFIRGCPYNYAWRCTQKNSSATFSVSKKNINDYFEVFRILTKFLKEKDIYKRYQDTLAEIIYTNLIRNHIKTAERLIAKEELKEYLMYLIKRFIKEIDIKTFLQAQDLEEIRNIIWFKKPHQITPEQVLWNEAPTFPKIKRIKFHFLQICKEIGIYDILKRIKNFGLEK